MGEDRYGKLPVADQSQLEFCPLSTNGLRYVLETTPQKLPVLVGKLLCPQPVLIATSYRQEAIRSINGLTGPGGPLVETLDVDGSVEAAPNVVDRVDASFDVYNSGNTARDNGLVVVTGLRPVLLGAVWRRDV